ncbi:HlyD family secretion protein [Sphingomonas oryzagri]
MTDTMKHWAARGGIVLLIAAVAFGGWWLLRPKGFGPGIVAGNGRIEATEIDVAAKTPGRIADILVDEGDFVRQGQVVAHIDTQVLEAQRAEAEAQLAQAQNAIQTGLSQVSQQESDRAAAQAVVQQRQAEFNAASKRLARSTTLAREGATPQQERDDDEASVQSARAAIEAARAQVAASDAAIATARSQVIGARSNVEAVKATIRRISADITDSALKAPRDGRIQYRIAQPGEVVAGGGKVLNLVDLSDVYMTFFLPEEVAGKVGMGSEIRIVLDAAPNYVIPAMASFVADVAQFTPKTVETASERQKLMFRVKARIAPALLREHIKQVKTGLPGMAYVNVAPGTAWPARLAVNVGQ